MKKGNSCTKSMQSPDTNDASNFIKYKSKCNYSLSGMDSNLICENSMYLLYMADTDKDKSTK